MKIKTLWVFDTVRDSSRRLSIRYWAVGKFPLTYTILECAEAWCESVGWELIHIRSESTLGYYAMTVEVDDHENINRTVLSNYYDWG